MSLSPVSVGALLQLGMTLSWIETFKVTTEGQEKLGACAEYFKKPILEAVYIISVARTQLTT